MVRSLLTLAFIASVLCSANAASQVGGSIRGSTAVGTESSASSALASAASSLLKVWPHPAAQVLHHATSAVRKLQADPLLPAEGDALEIACSSSSLETDEGIAECTALCAPAQCCQTGIGSENCGFAACLTYGDCLALASLFGVDVPPEAEDMVNGGEDGEDELVDESEMGMANADNTTDTTDGDDGDKPTGDGSFNDPEEGSLMDKLNDMAEGLKETAKQAMTDPSSLSTGAKVGIAIGCFIIFMMLVCLIKCCCCRKKSS